MVYADSCGDLVTQFQGKVKKKIAFIDQEIWDIHGLTLVSQHPLYKKY